MQKVRKFLWVVVEKRSGQTYKERFIDIHFMDPKIKSVKGDFKDARISLQQYNMKLQELLEKQGRMLSSPISL